MARNANSNVFLEEWLKAVSGSSVSSSLVKQSSAPSARSIVQAWSEIRESLQSQKFDTRYLQALRALVSSESTIHVADPQAKLLIAILALKDVSSFPYESCTLVVRLLYVWIRKAFRPSQTLVGSAVQAIRGVVDDGRGNLQPALVAQSVLVAGAFAGVPSLSGELKVLSLELLCRLLEEECCSMVGSRDELVPVVLAGIGYGLSSSSDVHYVRVLDSLFGIWLKDDGPRGSVTHGLMILHLVEWVVSGYMRSNYVDKMSLFANEVLETSKANYTVFAVLMAAAGVLRASAAGSIGGAQNLEVLSKLRNSAEKCLEAVAQLLVANGTVTLPTIHRDDLLLKCFAIALARCGTVSPSAPLLLCLASALLTQVFPLSQIYESFCKSFGKDPIGPRLIWAREHLSGVLFKESGAITGAFCNQYAKANEENKYTVENMIWGFCQNLYLQHRQIALLLRGVEDTLLGDIEKIAVSSFLMVVVFALAVTKQWLNPTVSEERKMETSVKILVSFSCVEYFRHIRLPEYMETIREVISCVQENDATCVSFVESIPAYASLTNPKDLFTQSIEYEWSRDDVQTSRILFYLRVIPTCIGRLSASAFRRVVASTMFLYIGHPNRKVSRASHTLFVAFLSSAKEPEEDERNQLKEDLVFYYMERSLEVYPEITPFEGLASGVAALTRHLPAGSPSIFYSVHTLVEKASTFNTEGKKSDPGNQILDLLLRLVSLVDIQVLPYLMKSLAQLIIMLPKERQNMVLGELYGQVAESDDVIRKPSLVSWLQSLNYLCSNNRSQDAASGLTIDTSNQLAARL
ncbi:Obscurin-like protein [Hirschfeldia incana]|nr:Obscurin-like protein [Hirschfeldia incana]